MRALGPGPPRKQGLWEGCAGRKGVTPSRAGRRLHPGPGCGEFYCHGDKEAVGGAQEREGASSTAFSSFLRCELHSQISPSLPLHGAHNIRPRHTHCPARPGPQTPHLVPLPAACPAAGHLLWAFTVPSVLWPPRQGNRCEGQVQTHAQDMLTVEQSAVAACGCPLGPAACGPGTGGGVKPASCGSSLTWACVSPSRNVGDLRRPDH